ncbi:hypothetical protein LB565_20095 [Mesorhizobium sp. CA14]|uniref:hypothetical protein n=1 Tax=Mesorhizobium sp. CA14 TaxID=2876642 RepID=UPI001CC979EA|nr:hypothetical protein [Mesorhizobium sp. CA14]MBZ9850289.1 hypothetical protein [Mesorhizobium sp. CA14]
MIIVLEGLEGVGKTTLGLALAEATSSLYVKTPPAEFNPVRGAIAKAENRFANFYFYLSSIYTIQKTISPFKLSKDRHAVVDRYIYSTIAYHADGEDFNPPPFPVGSILSADLTVHIVCSDANREARVNNRGHHIFERVNSNEKAILTYFARQCDMEHKNDVTLEESTKSLAERIITRFTK